jgi:hypothetical protein
MPALSDLPELVGFFSYSREDDENFDHALSKLRTRIQNELRAQLGRSKETLRLWQDKEAIPPGTLWASEIQAAVHQSVFFIPIVSPRVVRSEYCGTEFEKFLERERVLGRNDLVFPILFIDVPELLDKARKERGPVLKVIAERQYVDWREFRYDPDSPQVRREIAEFCKKIAAALRRVSPSDEAEGRRLAREAEEAEPREDEETQRRAQEHRRLEAEETGRKQQERLEAREATEAEVRRRETVRPRREPPTAPGPSPDAKKGGTALYLGLGTVGALIGFLAARGIGSPYLPGISNATTANYLLSVFAGAVLGVVVALGISLSRNRQ